MTLKPEHIVEALNKKTFDEIDPDEVLKHYGYKPEEVRCNGVGIGVWRKEEAFQKLGDIGAYAMCQVSLRSLPSTSRSAAWYTPPHLWTRWCCTLWSITSCMENILKVFLMAFPEWLACIFMMVGLVVTALAAVRLGYGLVVAKTVYKWIVNAEEKFGSGAGAEKKAHVIAVLRGYTPDWLDWAINERTLDWIVQLVFDFTKKKLEDYMAKKSAETTTVAHFGNVGENKRND